MGAGPEGEGVSVPPQASLGVAVPPLLRAEAVGRGGVPLGVADPETVPSGLAEVEPLAVPCPPAAPPAPLSEAVAAAEALGSWALGVGL